MDAAAAELALRELAGIKSRLLEQIGKVVVGQNQVIEQVLVALVSGGHCLIEGVPGLAKTLLVQTLAGALELKLNRIQFTPDLMPSDITGTEVLQEDRQSGQRGLRFIPGPLFGNLILADEVNRAPPKTQAALLEAMQERQVTAGGQRHPLPQPFFVLATQNPIEQEGTYPLPEAQLDRFMFYLQMDYPSEEEELEVVLRTTGNQTVAATPTVTAKELVKAMQTVRDIAVTEGVARYALRISRWSRPKAVGAPKLVQQYVAWGAGPRASQYLVLCGKARAALAGRAVVGRADVEAVANAVLRHRIRLNFSAQADSVTSDQIIQQLLQSAREYEDDNDKGLAKAFRSGNP